MRESVAQILHKGLAADHNVSGPRILEAAHRPQSLLKRHAELPEGTPVGVVGNSRTCTDNLLRFLTSAGLDHLDFFQIQEDDEESRSRIKRAKVVVCANAVAGRLPGLGIPEGVEILVQDRTLSKGGVEMLGQMLRRLPPSAA